MKIKNKGIKCIYLHAGFSKTATTSIQSTLLENNKLLHKKDIKFLHHFSYGIHNLFLEQPYRYVDYVKRNYTMSEIDKYIKERKNNLRKDILNCRQSNLLISDEGLVALKEHEVSKVKEFFKVLAPNADFRVLICTRETFSHLTSRYQQILKSGRNGDLIYRKYYNNFYRGFIEKYVNIFGKKSLIVYKFETAIKHNMGPAGYFFELLNIDTTNINRGRIKKSNVGISDKAAEILEYTNDRVPLFNYEKTVFIITSELSKLRYPGDVLSIFSIRGNKFILDNDLANQIYKDNKQDILWLMNEFKIKYKLYKDNGNIVKNIYDKKYYEDIIRIYPTLSNFLKKMLYEFVKSKSNKNLDNDSLTILKDINKWIESNYSYIIHDEHIYENTKNEYKLLNKYKNAGLKKKCVIKNLFYYLYYKIVELDEFDANYYVKTYQAIKSINAIPSRIKHPVLNFIALHANFIKIVLCDPMLFFFLKGVYLGHNPNSQLDIKQYIINNPEIVKTGENAFIHYIRNKKC